MESFENQNTGSEQTKREQILATARIVELFRQDNDFEEFASLNFLSKKLEGLSEEQFKLCTEFIKREYNKFTISKQQRPGLYNELFYTRSFISDSILGKFSGEKLTLVLKLLGSYEDIDLCTEYFYKYEKKVIENLEKMSETQISSILLLSKAVINNLINIMKSRPETTAFLIENINTFTNEQITHLTEINKIQYNKNEKVGISIFGLLFLNKKIEIDIKEIFTTIKPQFLYNVYNELKETDTERVDESYYEIQIKQMQDDFLNQMLNKEIFIKYLKGNYIKKAIFRAGDVWQGR